MRRALHAALLAAILVRTVATAAQTTPIDPRNGLTLEQAIAEGLSSEPALRAAAFEVEAARGDARQAALRPNPAVSFEQREQLGGMDRQTSIGVDWPLDLFRRGPRAEAASRMVDVAEAALQDRRRLLAADIRRQYGDVLAAVRRLDLFDAVLAASGRTYDLLRNRVAEGAAAPLDRDLAFVDLKRLEAGRELALGQVAISLTKLKTLLGRAPDAPLTLTDSLEDLVNGAAAQAFGAALPAERGDVRQATAELALARARSRQAMLEGRPDIGLFAGYMRMDAGFPQLGLGSSGAPEPIQGVFHNAAAGLRLSIPLFNRGQGDIAAAKARELNASEMVRARRLGASAEVAQARARLDAARRTLAAYSGETRAVARRNLDVVRETYTLGRATLFDVLNEQRRYLEFEGGYLDALVETFSSQNDLRRALGEGK